MKERRTNSAERIHGKGKKSKALAFSFILCTLIAVMTSAVYAQGVLLLAKKVSGDLPLDVTDNIWESASPMEIPLSPQIVTVPMIDESSITRAHVSAIHNSKDIAFLIEWEDKTKDEDLDLDRFTDAVALEFPSLSDQAKPNFAMGDREGPVNIWYWSAARDTSGKGPGQEATTNETGEYTPNFQTDEDHLFIDEFQPGVLAGNPVSRPRLSPVENIVAQGFGSATNMDRSRSQKIDGTGRWEANKWKVVLKRQLLSESELDADFREGEATPISLAVWNGSEGHAGGKKVFSTWYYVGIETEERGQAYFSAWEASKRIALTPDLDPNQLADAGKEIFKNAGCGLCHSVTGETLTGPDLSRIGAESDVETMALFLYSGTDVMPPANNPPAKLTDAEITAVIAYLESLGGRPKVRIGDIEPPE
ncbi:MAG: c-type cytochrome [Proteobacteria bacterium]|nr:c-type cytochrome [Pseudomonadota bacterium]NIS68766.1 c-type cytochrome [Pseudomonadota bacterium]